MEDIKKELEELKQEFGAYKEETEEKYKEYKRATDEMLHTLVYHGFMTYKEDEDANIFVRSGGHYERLQELKNILDGASISEKFEALAELQKHGLYINKTQTNEYESLLTKECATEDDTTENEDVHEKVPEESSQGFWENILNKFFRK